MTRAADLVEDLKRPWRHGEHLDARGLVLDEPLSLDGLEVRGLDFSNAAFNAGFSARGTRFRGLTWMRGTRVKGACDLSSATFRTDFRADGLQAANVVLDDCDLQGVLSLAGARLGGLSLRHALVMANLTLEGASIENSVDLTGAEVMGGLWTAEARIATLNNTGAQISGRIRLPG